jgi:plasmid stability protein
MSVINLRDVPDDLHRRLRVAAAQRGEHQRDLILRAIERELDRLDRAGTRKAT